MTDERDPKLSRRYRELGAEEPSRELDQGILAAAHRAADKAHAPLVTPAGRHRWYFAFGAAAILVLAVAVTVQVERQQPDPEAIPASPAPVRSDREEGFSYQQEQQEDRKRAEVRKQLERPKALSEVAPTPAQEAPRAPSRDAANRVEVEPKPAPAPEKREQSAAAPAPQAAPSPEVMASAARLSPERLLERIAELRKEGRHDEADKALAEFRQRYPDYRISDEMLQKVERRK